MMWYPGPANINPFTRAKAADVNANFSAIAASFAQLPDPELLERVILLPSGVPGDYIGQFMSIGLNGIPTFSSGTGADSGLRTDLLSTTGATRVGYKAPGTGGLLRDLAAFLGETPISPEAYGAGGLGQTDDTQAWARVVARAMFSGQPIVAKGRYNVQEIVLQGTGLRVSGAGVGTIVKIPGTRGKLMFLKSDSIQVADMNFDATTQNQIDYAGHSDNDIVRIEAKKCIISRCTLRGSGGAGVDVGGGGVAIYNGSDNIVEYCAVYGVRDNSLFSGGIDADRNRFLFCICDGTYAQNNIFITASPNSAAVPGVFVYDNAVIGCICRNSGDTNIEFGIHTVRSICQGNNLMTATNPAVLMRDSTYFNISGNIIISTNGSHVDMISIVRASEVEAWEAFGNVSDNMCVGPIPRSGVYVGQSRVKVTGNYFSRSIRNEVIPADGSTLSATGVLVANGVNYCDVVGNTIRGFAICIDFNFASALNTQHLSCTVKGNVFEYASFCINYYGCVADRGTVFSDNTARAVRLNFLKGDQAVIVPTGVFPNAQLRCFNNTFDPEGMTAVGTMYSSGIGPSNGLLTTATARLFLIPEPQYGGATLGSSVDNAEGIMSLRFIGSPQGATFAISHSTTAANKLIGHAELLGSDGSAGFSGWAVGDAFGSWGLQRRGASTGNAVRYGVVDFTAV